MSWNSDQEYRNTDFSQCRPQKLSNMLKSSTETIVTLGTDDDLRRPLMQDTQQRPHVSIQLNNVSVSVPQQGNAKKSWFRSNQVAKDSKRKVLNGVSGEFRAGRFTAILGGSGAGKTTLLNTIVHLLQKLSIF